MKKIGFIGLGNMAGAILKGALKSGFLNEDDVVAYDIDESKYSNFNEYHLIKAKNEKELVENSAK